MSEQHIQQYLKFSFLRNRVFDFKVNAALKNCNRIKEYLISKDYLSKFDNKLNLVASSGFSNEVISNYLFYKGYKKDGSIKPITKYTIANGEIVKQSNVINCDVIIIDLYEKSVYLHSHIIDNNYITGYLIKEERISDRNKTLIFSNEKVKINIKNINKYDIINVLDDFVNKFIM